MEFRVFFFFNLSVITFLGSFSIKEAIFFLFLIKIEKKIHYIDFNILKYLNLT